MNREQASAAMQAVQTPVDRPEAVRKLTEAIWAVTHCEDFDAKEMLDRLALLSGMAVYALRQYADLLEHGPPLKSTMPNVRSAEV